MYAPIVFVDDGYIHQSNNSSITKVTKDFDKMKIKNDSNKVKKKKVKKKVKKEKKVENKIYKILSIDIGVVHLGLSISILYDDFTLKEIIWVNLIDITKFHHRDGITRKTCPMYHDKTMSDWLDHIFVLYEEFFTQCDYILIERQPPMGFVVIEQLIFAKYRDKAQLISPNSMHKYFNIREYDYDQRKVKVEEICLKMLKHKHVKENYLSYCRQHDIADSICLMLYWSYKKNAEYLVEQNKKRIMGQQFVYRNSTLTLDEWFEQFRYRPGGRHG